jgi:biopolymer transport protein ExbB
MTMKSLQSRNSLTGWVAALSVAAVLAVGSAPAHAQQSAPADQSAAPAAPAPDQSAAPAAGDQTAAPAAAPVGLQSTPTTTVENPYGLEALWAGGDFVSRGTLIILTIMSMGTWYIMLTRLWDQTVLLRQAATARKSFWTAGSLKEGMAKLEANSAFRAIVDDGLKAAEHHEGKMTDTIDLNEWVTMSLQRTVDNINSRMQAGLAFLATVGSTAPFVGLFGTVWGIYHALIAIGVAGQASIDKVAGPVGEALIMTAIGLFVAVPAVLGYNWLIRRNKNAMEQVRNFSADIHAVLLSGARVASSGTARARA